MSQANPVKPCINGCGAQSYWKYEDGKNRPYNAANNERHMCPNFTPRQRRDDIKQTQGYQPQQRLTGTFPGQQQKNQAIQEMHDEKTELTKAYHKILERQNELKERELELLERQVKTQEWMSQTVHEEQATELTNKTIDANKNLLKDKKEDAKRG